MDSGSSKSSKASKVSWFTQFFKLFKSSKDLRSSSFSKKALGVLASPSVSETVVPEFVTVHQDAVSQGLDTYLDPETGFTVFTSLFLQKRGFCCKSGCRHCPYGLHTPS